MFGFQLPQPTTAYCGYRAILENGHASLVPGRMSGSGSTEEQNAIVKWANGSGAWKRMRTWAADQSGSSNEVFEERGELNGRTVLLMASPQASHGYLYIGLGLLDAQAA